MAKAKLVTLRLPVEANKEPNVSVSPGITFISDLNCFRKVMCTELGIVGQNLARGTALCNTKGRTKPVLHYFETNSKDLKRLKAKFTVEGAPLTSFLPRINSKIMALDLECNMAEEYSACGRLAPLEHKWREEATDSNYTSQDEDKRFYRPNLFIAPLPLDRQTDRTNYINKFNKEPSHTISKPVTFGSRINNRHCNLYTVSTQQKRPLDLKLRVWFTDVGAFFHNAPAQTYADPVCGAPASFLRRLSEMSSLEGETLRYERFKKLKKTKRLEM